MTIPEQKEEAKKHVKFISAVIDTKIDQDNMDEVVGKINELTQIMGLSAEVMAKAKYFLHTKELEVLQGLIEQKLSPMIMNKMLAAMCGKELAFFTLCDRLNAGITHAIDGLRSITSLRKSEIENSLKFSKA